MKKLFNLLFLFIGIAPAFNQDTGLTELKEHLNISYGGTQADSMQKLNLFVPAHQEKTPLLIWIGGGAWSYGDKNMESELARKFAQQGIAVACLGHRLSPAIWRDSSLNRGVQHPCHIQDIALAVRWLFDHANQYGYTKEQLFIGGYSSGAHLASLISLDSTYLNSVNLSPKIFKGVIPVSGTYDIMHYHEILAQSDRPELAQLHVEAVFGADKKAFEAASPSNFTQNLSTPMLLMSDNNMYTYSIVFEKKIRETNFRNMMVVHAYEFSHGELWRDLSFNEESMYRNVLIQFIKSELKLQP
jgi:hypothetical protein